MIWYSYNAARAVHDEVVRERTRTIRGLRLVQGHETA